MTLGSFTQLRPKTDHFIKFGPPQLLICLFGTMNIAPTNLALSIEVWIPKGYPMEAPFVYVFPPPGIPGRTTSSIDETGRFFHPLMGMWGVRGDANLVEMLMGMQRVLSAEPPCHQQQSPQSQNTNMNAKSPSTSGMSEHNLKVLLREKLQRRFKDQQQEWAFESDDLLEEGQKLEKGERSLLTSQEKLLTIIKEIEKEIETIRLRKETISNLSNDSELDLDCIVRPQGPIAKQIIDLTTEEMSLEDTLYSMGKAFLDGKLNVPLATYLKSVRDVARDQFMVKALILKIRKEFPLINE